MIANHFLWKLIFLMFLDVVPVPRRVKKRKLHICLKVELFFIFIYIIRGLFCCYATGLFFLPYLRKISYGLHSASKKFLHKWRAIQCTCHAHARDRG